MNEKTIDQIEKDVLSYEVADEAVEAAGTRTAIAGAWTFRAGSSRVLLPKKGPDPQHSARGRTDPVDRRSSPHGGCTRAAWVRRR
jgi:hypothetical protein